MSTDCAEMGIVLLAKTRRNNDDLVAAAQVPRGRLSVDIAK
jgi:hypothetical protein